MRRRFCGKASAEAEAGIHRMRSKAGGPKWVRIAA
jgi:hypothetical protein